MLPSTGYFKGIICPFNENGLCERPYCHYRHLDFDESGAILQKLVSAAVLKALQQNDTSGTKSSAQQSQGEAAANPQTTVASSASKATYNPTPIAELNKINSTDTENLEDPNEQRKRHIPVPYTPRKPAGLPIKRSVDINDPKPFVYNPPAPPIVYKPGSAENVPNDTYTPSGTVESKEKYLPGTEKEIQEYTPDSNTENSPNKLNYVPTSDKTGTKKKILEYKPAKVVRTDKPFVTYQPTPRSLVPCFSSDEDEPQTKKRKLSSDLNGLDDLGPEFDILDQILDEEKPDEKDMQKPEKSKNSSEDSLKSNGDITKSENNYKSHLKNKSDKNYENTSEKRSPNENKKSNSDKRSSEETHKSKSDKKSLDENHRKKLTDENHKSRSDKKTDDKSSDHLSKSEKKYDENHTTKSDKKPSSESHKSKSDKKSSSENHTSKSNKKESDDNHTSKSHRKEKTNSKDRKEKKHDHTKSSHKSSSKDRERDSKEKHSGDSRKCSSKSSNHSPKHSKKTEKSSKSRSSSSSKSKEKKHKKSKDKDRHRRDKKDSSDPETLDMDGNGMESEDYDLSDADEDTIALECKRIFEEYVPTEKPKSPDENVVVENQEEEYIPSKKRVSRTVDKKIKVIPRAPIKPDFKVSAANTMAERLTKVREFHNSRNIQSATLNPPVHNEIRDNTKIELQKATFSTPNPVPSKIRIAHVPYASTMLNTKKTAPPSPAPVKLEASSSTTISQTVKKGVQRVAHMPSEKFIDRPGVLEPLASKIPANIRSIYLNMMIDECLKLYLSTHDAYARAQHEELATSKKCSTVPIYKNSAVLAVSRLRKELVECNGVKKSANDCSTLKPGTSLKATNSGSWSIESKNKRKYEDTKEFTGIKFYENIKKWILTEEQLKENSFPRRHESGQNGRAVIYGQNKQNPPKGYIRTCCRCKKEYTVNKKGFAVVKEECIYHPNRKYRVRGEARYQCCTQDGTSDGCCVAPSHVYEYVDFEHLKGYVTTMPPDPQLEDYGVYSLDCEMCYTTSGLELTRVTVINSACKVVYESFVKPLHPIIDYNTRYSGITEEHMCHVKTTLLDVQATLLTMFSSKTILVGHSLESDFKALKLIHDTVIDTSVLFPHKMGPPFKRALRNLSTDYLRKIIQNSVEGHDSAEDAMVCMELLHYKLKEDLKSR